MSKPKSQPVAGANLQQDHDHDHQERSPDQGGPAPLSGSKKVKTRNHVSHRNPEGS